MTKSAFAAVLLLAFCTHTRDLRPSQETAPRYLRDMLQTAYSAVSGGKPAEALEIYMRAYSAASRDRCYHTARIALTSAAGCEMVLMRYRNALRLLYQARTESEQHGDCATMALIEGNISSIHVELGDIAGAMPGAQRVVQLRSCVPSLLNRAQALLHLGRLHSLQGNPTAALELFQNALGEIRQVERTAGVPSSARDAEPDARFELRFVRSLAASALDRLGAELINQDMTAAEEALSVSYRYRWLDGGTDLYLSRYQLAKLKLAQHKPDVALRLIDAAIATSPGTRLPPYLLYHLRGRILLAIGDLEKAVVEFRRATQAAVRWRSGIIPSDRFRTATDATLQEIYDSLIESTVELYQRTGRTSLIEEAWDSMEANRAAGLREGFETNRPEKDTREYWEMLTRLRVAEARAFAGNELSNSSEVSNLRLALSELDARAAVSFHHKQPSFQENKVSNFPLSDVRRKLGKSGTFMSFHIGRQVSFRWTVTRGRIQLTRLPSLGEIESLSSRFRNSVLSDSPDAAQHGHRLYHALFSGDVSLSAPANWYLALEGPLFDIPLAALVTSFANGRPQYLIERNTVEVVPGAWAMGTSKGQVGDAFLGIGDAVYNRADSRFQTDPRSKARPVANWLLAFGATGRSEELPRLIGSGREIAECARNWKGQVEVLSGVAVTRDRIVEALKARPAVVHFATHFMASRQTPDQTLLMLSLQPSTQIFDLLTSNDVAALSLSGATVVLSGCSSAMGRPVPGAGLLGLTRAFLRAGATSVIASHWAIPDDSGEMFARFYAHLNTEPKQAPAGALRAAQLEMLRGSSWRSAPRYWAAFQLTGRSSHEPRP